MTDTFFCIQLDLSSRSELIESKAFLSSSKPIAGPKRKGLLSRLPSAGGLASSVAVGSLTWALSQLGISSSDEDDLDDANTKDWSKAQGDWVCWKALEEAADRIIEEHYQKSLLSSVDSLYTRQGFEDELCSVAAKMWNPNSTKLGTADVQALLKHLERDRQVISMDKQVRLFDEIVMH